MILLQMMNQRKKKMMMENLCLEILIFMIIKLIKVHHLLSLMKFCLTVQKIKDVSIIKNTKIQKSVSKKDTKKTSKNRIDNITTYYPDLQ